MFLNIIKKDRNIYILLGFIFNMVFKKMRDSISGMFNRSSDDPEYIEIDLGQELKKNKIMIKTFILKRFEDVNPILNSLREGYTIAIVDIKPLKTKDIIELKRAIAKIKKTADALEGSIAGFGESMIIVTPSFAEIYKSSTKIEDVDRKSEEY